MRLSLIALVLLSMAPSPASACSGCGCRGGPGYRGPNGQCVSWNSIGKVCGSPPSSRCSAEGPNAGAEEAADLGDKANRLAPAKRAR